MKKGQIKCLKNGAYQYHQDDKLGVGSFATVYKGIITKNKRIVAIRLQPLKLIDQYGQKIKQIIKSQVRVLKDLSLLQSDQAIFTTRIYDCFLTTSDVVMILQLCTEGNLQELLKTQPLPQSQALQVLYQIARGLQFISNQKVVHRDIKPQNIFIKKYGNDRNDKIFTVGDFGFAVKKQLNSQVIGTPVFMSPQLFKQQTYGSQVDVWAFGLLAHYILFKQHYFIAGSQQKVKNRVLQEKYQLKQHHLKKISKQMSNFLLGCLQKDKKNRLSALTLSQHSIFNPIRNKMQQIINNVINIHKKKQKQLIKNNIKGKVTNQIVRYSFFVDLAQQYSAINSINCGSLYMIKHALGQLNYLKQQLQNKNNFINHPDWNNFCSCQDYNKTKLILTSIIQKSQTHFQNTFNTVIPKIKNRYGKIQSDKIQQNLGKGPLDRIKSDIVCYQLQNSWFSFLKKNITPQTQQKLRLISLEALVALHFYQNRFLDFDFTDYQMIKNTLNGTQKIQYLEKVLKSSSK